MHVGCLLEAIIKLPLFLLLLGLGWDWNNFDLIGGGFKKQNTRVKVQELVVTECLIAVYVSKQCLKLLSSDFDNYFFQRGYF